MKLPICDEFEFKSDDYLICFIRHMTGSGLHMAGTSKMGPDTDEESVVNPRLQVRGVIGLRQMDCGVIPKMPSGNTNAPCTMIGEKGAQMMKEDYL